MSLVILSLFCLRATAGEPTVQASGGVFVTGSDAIHGNAAAVIPRIGYRLNEHVAMEASAGFLSGAVSAHEGIDYRATSPRLEVAYTPATFGRIAPFVAAGPGALRTTYRADSEAALDALGGTPLGGFLATAGPGVRVSLLDSLQLRVDLRYAALFDGEGISSNAELSAGLEYRLGAKEPDTDGDGLADSIDVCPSEPEDHDRFEDADGCPDADNDQDGIADVDDACRNDPEDDDGFADDDGCPDTDNDQDQVVDVEDDCPSEPGVAERNGCPLVSVAAAALELGDRVLFEPGRAVIHSHSHGLLVRVAEAINAHPEVLHIEIGGHTDDQGSDAYNSELSQERADAVRAFLIEQGVDARRLSAQGYGESRPIADNNAARGRAKNRRVEFVITKRAVARS